MLCEYTVRCFSIVMPSLYSFISESLITFSWGLTLTTNQKLGITRSAVKVYNEIAKGLLVVAR